MVFVLPLLFLFLKSGSKQFIIKCLNKECTFKSIVSLGKGIGRWVITKVSGSYTCTYFAISQDHIKLDSNLIYDNIESLVNSDASLKVKHIMLIFVRNSTIESLTKGMDFKEQGYHIYL